MEPHIPHSGTQDAPFAAVALPQAKLDRLVALCRAMEEVEDMRDVLTLMTA